MIEDEDSSLEDEEFPDDVDMDDSEDSETHTCPECGREVHEDCAHCPSCGHWITAEEPDAPRRIHMVWRVAAVLVVASMLWWVIRFLVGAR
jgi:uncharacterized paraquat-inducible protein A